MVKTILRCRYYCTSLYTYSNRDTRSLYNLPKVTEPKTLEEKRLQYRPSYFKVHILYISKKYNLKKKQLEGKRLQFYLSGMSRTQISRSI